MDGLTAVEAGADALPLHLLNQNNKQLTAQISFFEQECEKMQREVDDHKQRLHFMQDHLGNVKAEIINTQALYEAKRREVESEDHLCQLAERERGRLTQKIGTLDEAQSKVQEKIEGLQNRIFQGNLRMDEFKAAMNFNQEELEQWDLARKQKEDDGVVLDRYSKVDEAKVRELNFQIEKLSKQVQKKNLELEEEITETQASQMELDKTAEDFKELQKERQYLLSQWEEAVQAMHRRDAAIKTAGDRYAEGKQWLDKRQKQLKARAEFHQLEMNNNREIESKIAQEERVLAKYREDTGVLQKHLSDLKDEVDVVKGTLNKATHDKSTFASQKQSLLEDVEAKKKHLERLQQQQESVIKRMQGELEAAGDLEKQNKLVADLLVQTDQSAKALDKEMSRIKDEQYRNSQKLHEVRRLQATYLAEISGAQAQGRNMNAKIEQLDAQTLKQQELLYTIEFNIQQMERKVNRAKGERTEEEKRELQEKIDMLQKMLDDLLKQHKVLETQVKRVNEDLRQSRYDVSQAEKEKKRVTNELLELTLENESCNIELQKIVKEKQESLVHVDILKLQTERLRRVLMTKDDELLGLENRKQQLDLTISEREMEIRVHQDVLRMEIKAAEDERKAVCSEFAERTKTVTHLKNRFEVLIGRMDKEQGEMTHAQHIVRTAKEREELQLQGDQLDASIKKAEKEMRKLEKTIAILQGSNIKFKHQFSKVSEGDEEVINQKMLQQKNKELMTIINRRTGEMKDFLKTEMSKMTELREKQFEKDEAEKRLNSQAEGVAAIGRELEEQRELVARYEVAINKAKRTTEPEIVQDIDVLEEQEKQTQLVSLLLQVAQGHGEELYRVVEGTLQRNNIPLPEDVQAGGEGFEPPQQ